MEDSYLTIKNLTEVVLFKDKSSKFYAYAFPVIDEETAKIHIDNLKKAHKTASHWCFAYKIGTAPVQFRVNDDGEPNNSAGMPIYGQIQSYKLTNVLIVVVRYYGGVKLGVSGLINAYKTAAQQALENAKIVEKTINQVYRVHFEYKNMNVVMRIVKEFQLKILQQDFNEACFIVFELRKSDAQKIESVFNSHHELKINPVND